MTKVLLVEDDPTVAEPLACVLGCEDYEVSAQATDGTALQQVEGRDIAILDSRLPDMDGPDVARTIRAQDITIPILILIARIGEIDTVVGLGSGADDYVTKPFRPDELLVRVRALL